MFSLLLALVEVIQQKQPISLGIVIKAELGVDEDVSTFIEQNLQGTRMLGAKHDNPHQPEPVSIRQAARERVIVRTFVR